MSRLNSFIKLAKQAMDSSSASSSSSASGSRGGAPGQSDWMSRARGAVDSLLGDERAGGASTQAPAGREAARDPLVPPPAPSAGRAASPASSGTAADRAAIARYDYLLQTARPDQVEQVHREAFARLTPDQREQIAAGMRAELPAHERPHTSSAPDLARAAARTEAAEPGRLRGLLARAGGRGGRSALGGAALVGGGVLGAVAGGAIVTGIGSDLLGQALTAGIDFDAIAEGIGVQAIAEGAGGLVPEAGEYVQGLGDQVAEAGSGLGDLASGFELPGLDDLFGR